MFALNTQTFAKLAVLSLASILFTGCFMASEDEGADMDPARVTIDMHVSAPETLAKASGAAPSKMIVLMTSSKRDTVCDTITSKGSLISVEPTLLSTSTGSEQTVTALYNLLPNRAWKIAVKILDARDSVRNVDSLKIEGLKAFDSRTVSMALQSRFAAYTAGFSLPASVPVDGQASLRQVYFTRLELAVDGQVTHDSIVPAAATGTAFITADAAKLPGSAGMHFFRSSNLAGLTSVMLTDEYVSVGGRQITLSAYGYLEGDTVGVTRPRLLFQGGRAITAVLGKTTSEAVSLDWKATEAAAVTGNTGLVVRLEKPRTVVINATMSGALDF